MTSDLTPEFTTRIRFTFNEVLPAHDPVAQWIVNLARALNDLMLANARLSAGFAAGTPAPEHFYDIRAIALHAWELAKFLRRSERSHDEIVQFIGELDVGARQDYRQALDALSEPAAADSASTRSFKRNLGSARDQSTHYSKIGHSLLRAAMERIGDQEGELLIGKRFKDFRADFAADVDAQMFFAMKGDQEPFRQFATELQRVVEQLTRFVRAAIDRYLLDREDLLTVESHEAP